MLNGTRSSAGSYRVDTTSAALPCSTALTLAARVLTQEHIIYPRAVRNLVRAL